MSGYNKNRVKQIYDQYLKGANGNKDFDTLVFPQFEAKIVDKIKSWVNVFITGKKEYNFVTIPKDTTLIYSANLSSFEDLGRGIKNDELDINNTELFELYENDPARRRTGSRSFTFLNDSTLLSKNNNPFEMSLTSVYSGIMDRFIGRLLFYTSKKDMNIIDVLDYDITFEKIQENNFNSYRKRIKFIDDFIDHVYGEFMGNTQKIHTHRDNPGVHFSRTQRFVYLAFELYRAKKSPSDIDIDGMFVIDGNIDPLLYNAQKTEVYFLPGIELLAFSPENDTQLESIFYVKDEIMVYDFRLWKKLLETSILPKLRSISNKFRKYNFDEYSRINSIINNYARKCRSIIGPNDFYNPKQNLKNITIKLDTECSCLLINKFSTNNNPTNNYVQSNKFPLLMKKENNGLYPRGDQNRAFITQELCLRDMSNQYDVPYKPDGVIRIMSYNIHYWQGPKDRDIYQNIEGRNRQHYYTGMDIVNIIKDVDPDILCLQEVINNDIDTDWAYINWTVLKNELDKMNYNTDYFCAADAYNFGNMILFKKNLNFTNISSFSRPSTKGNNRCTIHGDININGKDFTIYNTHLEVSNADDRQAFTDIIVNKLSTNPKNKILMGDFNSTRDEYPFNKITSSKFVDMFTKKNLEPPSYTTWTGTEIDFIFLSEGIQSSDILGCFVVHTPVSDHLPIFIDIKNNSNPHYDKYITLVPNAFDNSITKMMNQPINTMPSELNWYKDNVPINKLDESTPNRHLVNLSFDKMMNINTILDRIPQNILMKLGEINPDVKKYFNSNTLSQFNILEILSRKPLINDVGENFYNLVDNSTYDLINFYMVPLANSWKYGQLNIHNWGADGEFGVQQYVVKISKNLLKEYIESRYDNAELINLLNNSDQNADVFVEIENVLFRNDLSKNINWISYHAFCYYYYTITAGLGFNIPDDFDKIFVPHVGLFPLNFEVNLTETYTGTDGVTTVGTTMPINKVEQRNVQIHPVGDEMAFSPHDQTSYIITKDDPIKREFVSYIKDVVVDGTNYNPKPCFVLHIIDGNFNDIVKIIKNKLRSDGLVGGRYKIKTK